MKSRLKHKKSGFEKLSSIRQFQQQKNISFEEKMTKIRETM